MNGFSKILLSFLIGSSLMSQPNNSLAYEKKPGRTLATYQEWRAKTNTPRKMHDFYWEHLEHYPDVPGAFVKHDGTVVKVVPEGDYMQDPIDTYLRGRGDCDCFARLGQEWMRFHGYKSYLISIRTEEHPDEGHTVLIVEGKNNGRIAILGSNDNEFGAGFESIDDAITRISPDWTHYFRIEPDNSSPTGFRRYGYFPRGEPWNRPPFE